MQRIGPSSPKSTIGGMISPSAGSANGEMINENGTDVCFIMSGVAGTLYMVERMNRGPELPWSCVTNLVVTSGGMAPTSFVMNGPVIEF